MKKSVIRAAVAALSLSLMSGTAAASTNVIPAHWSVISSNGIQGSLRAGSPWGPGSTPSNHVRIVDDSFQPEMTQWNNGSFWWDQDASINPDQLFVTVALDASYTFNHLVVQADDNDSYLLEYWDGSAWQTAWNIPTLPSFGLRTRDSGTIANFTTNQFRFSAVTGDNYYSIAELQAFTADVPEPMTWALMVAGFGFAGAAMRRRPARTMLPA
jgi:PEP-CTERM motif